MNTYFKYEFKRILFSKKSLVVFCLTLLLFIISYINFIDIKTFDLLQFKTIYDSLDVFISVRKDALILIAPILSSFIYSDSYLIDSDSKYINFIYLRISKIKYIHIKWLINSIVPALVITFTSLIFFICLNFFFGFKQVGIQEHINVFNFIYAKSRFLYLIVLFITEFIFCSIFANLSLGLSPWIKNRYLTIISSFIFHIISGTLLGYIGLYKLNTTILFNLTNIVTPIQFIIYQCSLFCIGSVLLFYGVKKNDQNN